MLKEKYDVLIVGGGLAGLYAAINIDSSLKVLLLAKQQLELSNSVLAQGGVAAVIDKTHDDYRLHIADTLIAGGYKNNLEALEVLVTEGPECVLSLPKYGVEFDEDRYGHFAMTLEGGHSRNRIVHHKDTTGHEIVVKLIEAVKALPNVEVMENVTVAHLEQVKNGFAAGLLLPDDEHVTVKAHKVILATGGIGRVFKYTTNSAIATGDGIMLAKRMGARIKNLSYVQFHPTAFAADNGRERFLISEAVRGEGAYYLNCNMRRFLFDYDDRGELAPRDVVSRHVIEESKKTGSEKFYLDITYKPAEFIKDRFPGIYKKCLEEGVDITKDPIPVFPCQHYLMGGIDVDTWARTTVSGLYACGECSHTGVHGENRLASNSLLEAMVFSRRAAIDISANLVSEKDAEIGDASDWFVSDGDDLPKGFRTAVREILQKSFFVFINKDEVRKGIPIIEETLEQLNRGTFKTSKDLVEATSIVTLADIILKEVLDR